MNGNMFKSMCIFIFCVVFIPGCNQLKTGNEGFPKTVEIRALTTGPAHHFASGYYHTCSWNASGKYLMCLETDVFDHDPEETETAVLGLIDMATGQFKPVATTHAFNFQQGAMQHWLGTDPESKIIYNDRREGKFVSVILDINTKEERVINRPVSAVSNDGKTAASLNYARIRLTRPGYGYAGKGDDPKMDTAVPEDDGLFLIDLTTGESKLIVSTKDALTLMPLPDENKGQLVWFNHTVFSLDDTRIFFMARTQLPDGGARLTAAFTVNQDGSELRCILPYNWGASHYDWISGDRIMVTTRYQGKTGYWHVLFTDGKDDYRILGPGILRLDGHGAFSDDGRWMVTDTYPDELEMRSLLLLNMENDAVLPLGRFHVPPVYTGPHRCDLHPGFNHKGNKIVFDSVHDGTRQVYLAELVN